MDIRFLGLRICNVCAGEVDMEWADSMDGFAGIQEHPRETLSEAEKLAADGHICSWECFDKCERGLA